MEFVGFLGDVIAVPTALSLRLEAIKSMLLVSDVFTLKNFVSLLSMCRREHARCGVDDDPLVAQYLVVGICKVCIMCVCGVSVWCICAC